MTPREIGNPDLVVDEETALVLRIQSHRAENEDRMNARNISRVPKTALLLYRDAVLYFALLAQVVIVAASFGSNNLVGNAQLADASGSFLNQFIVWFTFLNSVIIAIQFRVRLSHIVYVLLPAILIMGWILLSVTWSEFPDLTIRRAGRALIEVTSISLLALSLREPRAILRVLFWSFLITLLLDMGSVAVPSRSFTAIGFAGIHEDKNELGAFLFSALPVFAIGTIDRAVSKFSILSAAALIGSALMLVVSLSKSAIGIFAICSALVLLTRLIILPNAYSRLVLPLMALLMCLSIGVIVFDVGIAQIFAWLFGDATLTGRSELWRYALYRHDLQPWYGVGYGALWQIGGQLDEILKATQLHWLANQAHNGYIDVLAQLGNVGLFLAIFYMIYTFVRVLRYAASFEGMFLFGFGSYALYLFWGVVLYNITESSLFRIGHPTWILFVLVTSCVANFTFQRRHVTGTPVLLRHAA